jgi:hypothetical protein
MHFEQQGARKMISHAYLKTDVGRAERTPAENAEERKGRSARRMRPFLYCAVVFAAPLLDIAPPASADNPPDLCNRPGKALSLLNSD